MIPIERHTGLDFAIDTHQINSTGKLEHMNVLEELHRRDVITLHLTEQGRRETESEKGVYGRKRQQKAAAYMTWLNYADNAEERRRIELIAQTVFPSKYPDRLARRDVGDVLILFNAAKYRRPLITSDGAMLRAAPKLRELRSEPSGRLGLEVMTDEQALELVRRRVRVRDENARTRATLTGTEPPDWVGSDSI